MFKNVYYYHFSYCKEYSLYQYNRRKHRAIQGITFFTEIIFACIVSTPKWGGGTLCRNVYHFFTFQGALSGGIASVVFVLWIFIGQIFLGSMSKTLPLPTSGCHLNETFNGTLTTVGSATYSYVTSMTTPTDVIPTGR